MRILEPLNEKRRTNNPIHLQELTLDECHAQKRCKRGWSLQKCCPYSNHKVPTRWTEIPVISKLLAISLNNSHLDQTSQLVNVQVQSTLQGISTTPHVKKVLEMSRSPCSQGLTWESPNSDIQTDPDALQLILNISEESRNLTRWCLQLPEFELAVVLWERL